jgi:hypothetical protein
LHHSCENDHVFANMHGIDCWITKPQCTYVSGWIMANITNNQLVVEIGRSYRACHPNMYVFYRIRPMQTVEWFSWALVWGMAYNIKVSINIGLAHDHSSTWVSGFKSSYSCFCMPPFLHCDRVFSKIQSVRDDVIDRWCGRRRIQRACVSPPPRPTPNAGTFQARCGALRDLVSVI